MRFAVIGDPIAHSKSPAMHAAAYRALGLGHSYVARQVKSHDLQAAVAELRNGTFDGYNVTVPHKIDVLSYVDEIADTARAIGAANTLARNDEGKIVAHNTDGPALRDELRALYGGDLESHRCSIVLGNGGAARAAVWALEAMGSTRTVVRARSVGPETMHRPFATTSLFPGDDDVHAAIVVQATSAGMRGADDGGPIASAIDWSALRPDAAALDVIYGVDTPFLRAARARGLRVADGSGMLVRQGAIAFSLWLKIPAPIGAMRAALEAV